MLNKTFSLKSFYNSVFPTKHDNFEQIAIKILYLLTFVFLISFFCFISVYFSKINTDQNILSNNKQVFSQFYMNDQGHYEKALNYFKKKNNDLKGWITIENTDLSVPIYQSNDNKFYLNHNQFKKESDTGILFFDSNDDFSNSDKNLIIYGKNKPQLFSCLEKYKSLYYYRQYPIINFSTLNSTDQYYIFAVFLINSKKQDDQNRIFNYKKSSFNDENDFSDWYNEITQRNLYSTDISVTNQDNIITLVTDTSNFKGAKLVVMAKKINVLEEFLTPSIEINKNPRFPQVYYDINDITNPFDYKEEENVPQS